MASPEQHVLEGEAFQNALERYVDENKPDPLVRKQIESFELSWEPSSSLSDATTTTASNNNSLTCPRDLSFTPTDVVQGVLTWKGEYKVAKVEVLCCWEPQTIRKEPASDLNGNSKDVQAAMPMSSTGSLYFSLQSTLSFRNEHEKRPGDKEKSKEDRKADEKIQKRMTKRLKEDVFIKKLLSDNDDKVDDDDNPSKATTILCQARVSVQTPHDGGTSQFEERVDVTDSVAEGLRRAIFSSAESSLEVVEFLLSLPILPGSSHKTIVHCPLADRAKLRLLEDAMFDACEREGEDEIIDDLKISVSQDHEKSNDATAETKKPRR